MKVILLEDVKSLGKKGQLVEVNAGYARNFILPKKLGVEATSKNLNDLKLQKANDAKIAAEQLAAAKELAEKLNNASVTVSIKAGEGGRAFGAVSSKEIEKAAKDIVNGCSFDNNLPCIAEKEVIAVDQIADYLIFNMKNNGAYEVKDPEIIEKMVDLVTKDRKKPAVNFVGKSAQYILDKVGIKVGPEVKCIIMEAPKDHPFVQIELMMPILPIVRVPNVDEAIDFAVEVEHGNRHTAMMHSKNVDKLTKMAKEIETTIFVKNGPSYAGIGVGGMGYTTFTIAGPTGEGLTSAKSFCRKRRCVLQDGLHIRMK